MMLTISGYLPWIFIALGLWIAFVSSEIIVAINNLRLPNNQWLTDVLERLDSIDKKLEVLDSMSTDSDILRECLADPIKSKEDNTEW